MPSRWLILETSHRLGKVALALDESIVGTRTLEEARRHTRDLVPSLQELLQEQGWRARDLEGVMVSRGPGSYTGLRVGLMAAKTLAYATGCALLALDTFEAIMQQLSEPWPSVDVIADAQQDKVYVQRFGPQPQPLAIVALQTWIEHIQASGGTATGPGLETYEARLPASIPCWPREHWTAQPLGLLQAGLKRWRRGQRDDLFAVEPLYLRVSSAEEKWQALGR